MNAKLENRRSSYERKSSTKYDYDQVQEKEKEREKMISRMTQRMSCQESQVSSVDLCRRSKMNLTGRADLPWNKVQDLSKKYLETVCTATVLRMEEDGIKMIEAKIEKEKQLGEKIMQVKQKGIEQVRDLFLMQHERNIEKEKAYGLVPYKKPTVILNNKMLKIRPYKDNLRPTTTGAQPYMKYFQKNNIMDDVEKPTPNEYSSVVNIHQAEVSFLKPRTSESLHNRKHREFKQKFVDVNQFASAQEACKSDRIETLSQPKANHMFSSTRHSDRTEFQGLIQIDYPIELEKDTERAVISISQSRPSSKLSMIQKGQKNDQPLNSEFKTIENLAMDELNEFERKLHKKDRRVGFPKVTLENQKLF